MQNFFSNNLAKIKEKKITLGYLIQDDGTYIDQVQFQTLEMYDSLRVYTFHGGMGAHRIVRQVQSVQP